MRNWIWASTVLMCAMGTGAACSNVGVDDTDGMGGETGGSDTGGSSSGGSSSGGSSTGGTDAGGGEGGMGGMGGGSGGGAPLTLAEACTARCETTTSIGCQGNGDQTSCEQDCEGLAVEGCEDEYYALTACESQDVAGGFQCLNPVEGFYYVAQSGSSVCFDEFDAEDACISAQF